MQSSLYEILTGENKPEMSAEDAEKDILAEFERLGGAV
jgi:hypothetical protein